MLSCLLGGILIAQSDGARATLEFVRDRYARLGSFQMTIQHHDSSGLYPGDYTQDLKVLVPGRFELKVLNKSRFEPKPDLPGGLAPDFYSDGAKVLAIRDKAVIHESALMPDENTMPGWEVAGGPILGWMMGTPTSKSYVDPPKNMKSTLRFGSKTQWRGEDVREIEMVIGDPQKGLHVSLFIDRLGQRLVGFEWSPQGKTGWAYYKNQHFNPRLPTSLGTAPKD